MAYEVTKQVGSRSYRYRVESYRDPATRKVRSRWTYLGIVGAAGAAHEPVKRTRPERTRARLIDAFEALALELPYADIGAGAVAFRADVAHGTFYRHFPDKRALLLAAIDRLRREFDRVRPDFSSPLGSVAQERARVRTWLETLFAKPGRMLGIIRAYFDAMDSDTELRAMKAARSAERVASLAAYFERLSFAKLATITDPAALALALTILIDGALRAELAAPSDAGPSSAAIGAGVIDAFDRAIFAQR